MKKNRGYGYISNNHEVAKNNNNVVITLIAANAVWIFRRNHIREFWTYNWIFVVEQLLLSNNVPIAIINALYEVPLVDN